MRILEVGPSGAGSKGRRVLRVQESASLGTLRQALLSSLYLICQAEPGRVFVWFLGTLQRRL